MADCSPIRVLVADDQAVVREGLEMLLGLSPGIEVVGVARDGEEAIGLVAERSPDVVLMDLRMPRVDGVEATRRITRQYPGTRVVVLTTYADDESIFGALEAGAQGYLTKDSGAQEIQRAIRTVHAGEALLDPSVQLRLIRHLSERGGLPAGTVDRRADVERQQADAGHPRRDAGNPQESAPTLPDGLTQREAEVLRLIAGGLNNREIADRLFITEATVKTHINNIFSKAELRDRAQAVVYAIRHGLTPE
jgi:DNA-binding NarL/FixJ family response regulator